MHVKAMKLADGKPVFCLTKVLSVKSPLETAVLKDPIQKKCAVFSDWGWTKDCKCNDVVVALGSSELNIFGASEPLCDVANFAMNKKLMNVLIKSFVLLSYLKLFDSSREFKKLKKH